MRSNSPGSRPTRAQQVQKFLAAALLLLMAALFWQGERVWDFLSGAPRGDELLFCAAGHGTIDDIDRALQQGADINARSPSECTPLMHACDNGNSNTVRSLLARGADPSLEARAGLTAIQFATVNDNPEIVELLLNAGVNPNRVNNGETILDVAQRMDHDTVAAVLLSHGARPAADLDKPPSLRAASSL